MTAVDSGDTGSIKNILAAAADDDDAGQLKLDVKDKQGCTVFHHVANAKNERIALVSSIVSIDINIINIYINAYDCISA
jgi:hypothetical protein